MKRKVKCRFKVGEIVEQIQARFKGEHPLCRITEISDEIIYHTHLNGMKGSAYAGDFKKVPKLKRILLSEV